MVIANCSAAKPESSIFSATADLFAKRPSEVIGVIAMYKSGV